MVCGIGENHHGWWTFTVLGWLRAWWTPYQNSHPTPLVHSNIGKKLISYKEAVLWRETNAEHKSVPFHNFEKAVCNYWLSQYIITCFIFRSACQIANAYQQNIVLCFALEHLLNQYWRTFVVIFLFSCFKCFFCWFMSCELLGVSIRSGLLKLCCCDPFWKSFFYATSLMEGYMLMIRANVSLQISGSIFVHGEIIQMHTIHESNYAVIKLPSNENSKEKKINKNNSVCRNYQA